MIKNTQFDELESTELAPHDRDEIETLQHAWNLVGGAAHALQQGGFQPEAVLSTAFAYLLDNHDPTTALKFLAEMLADMRAAESEAGALRASRLN